jgi:hypothetical protein
MLIPQPDGSITLPVHTTYEGIEEMYKLIRGRTDVLSAEAVLEVRGQWYAMAEAVAAGREKATGVVADVETILVLPVTSGPGITGELCWIRMDRELLGTAEVPLAEPRKNELEMRRHLTRLHEQLLAAFRVGDADGIAAVFTKGCQSAIRDYVEDTGTITSLDDVDGVRDHYRAFFDLYDVRSVELLHRVAQEWYLAAEIRVEVVGRAGERKGEQLTFHTATIFAPGKDDKFIVQIGHGTDLTPA